MTKTTDLFGKSKKAKPRKTRLERGLLNYDQKTFDGRLKRLELLEEIYPKGLWIGGDMEFVYTFSEAKECYIAGHFIATMILAQSVIEKIFYQYFDKKGLETVAKRGLDQMIKHARRHNLINSFILDKADALRLKRNPFTHSKDWDYLHTISKRMVKGKTIIQPNELLENDATEAIQVMFLLTTHKL